MRKTKIICTLGPSTDKDGVLEELVKEGMNVARFNFSHGLHDEQKGRIDKLKEIRTRLNKPVAALLDTKGPEIRIREFENEKVSLKEGQEFTLTAEEIVGNEKIVSVTYKDLYKDVKPGNSILIDDGLIGLEVKKIKGQDIICKVVNGGVLGNKKGVNLPGVETCRLSAQKITMISCLVLKKAMILSRLPLPELLPMSKKSVISLRKTADMTSRSSQRSRTSRVLTTSTASLKLQMVS